MASEAYGLGRAIAGLFAPPDPEIARQRMIENMGIANEGEKLIMARDRNAMLSGGGLGTALGGMLSPEQAAVYESAVRAGLAPDAAFKGVTEAILASGKGESLKLAENPENLNLINRRNIALSGKPVHLTDIKEQNVYTPYQTGGPVTTTEQGRANVRKILSEAAENYGQANSANALANARRAAPVAAAGGIPDGYFKVGSKLYTMDDNGEVKAVDSGTGRNIPSSAVTQITDARATLSKIEDVQDKFTSGGSDAFALPVIGAITPGPIKDLLDPQGTGVRQARAAVSTELTHALAGAALTETETRRLEPYLPGAEDSDSTIKAKLDNLRTEFQRILAEREQFYSPEMGYRPMPARITNASAAPLGNQVNAAAQPAVKAKIVEGW